jgi:hypothetical protein
MVLGSLLSEPHEDPLTHHHAKRHGERVMSQASSSHMH